MLLINNSRNALAHIRDGYKLEKGAKADIPDYIAKVWLEIPGVERYVDPEELEKVKAKAEAEAKEKQAALEKENEDLKKQIQELKDAAAKAEAEAKETAKKADKSSK